MYAVCPTAWKIENGTCFRCCIAFVAIVVAVVAIVAVPVAAVVDVAVTVLAVVVSFLLLHLFF